METCDVVAVLSPPAEPAVSSNQQPAIYHHTFDLALELVSARISRRLNLKERGVLQRFVVLETEGSAIPEACSSFTRFTIPGQLPKFIRYVSRNQDRRESDDSVKKQGLADRLIERCSEDSEATVMESFHMIYEHLRENNKSPDVRVQDTIVDDAKHVSERLSLLANETVNGDRDRRREQLDREFGPIIPSVTALPTLGWGVSQLVQNRERESKPRPSAIQDQKAHWPKPPQRVARNVHHQVWSAKSSNFPMRLTLLLCSTIVISTFTFIVKNRARIDPSSIARQENNLFSFFCLSPVQPDANQSSPVQHRVLCQACSTRFLHFCFPSSFDWLMFDVLCRPRHPIRTGLRPGGAEWYKMKGLLCKQPVQSKRKICTPFIPLSQSAWWLRNSNFLHFLFYRVCVCVCVLSFCQIGITNNFLFKLYYT